MRKNTIKILYIKKIPYSIDFFAFFIYNIAYNIAIKEQRKMNEKYQKTCRVCTDIYRIYYGKGVYRTQEQHETSHYDSDITITYLKSSQGKIRIEGKHTAEHNDDNINACTDENYLSQILVSFL